MKAKLAIALVAGAALVCVAIPQAVAAQIPEGDSVTSDAVDCFVDDPECVHYTWLDLDARSGPNGESPVGTGAWGRQQSLATFRWDGTVTCLAVHGHVAIVGFAAGGYVSTVVRVTDAGGPGSGQDLFEVVTLGSYSGSAPPPNCSVFPPTQRADVFIDGSAVNERGDIRVHDAQPVPTSTVQCKNGGWRNYGTTFRNQGDCVSFVTHQARQECLFIRAAHGQTAFRAQYGTPVTKRHAMRRCVRQRSED